VLELVIFSSDLVCSIVQ